MEPSPAASDRTDTGRRVAFDMTPLLSWYRYHRRVTGIQRVAERVVTTAPVSDDPAAVFVLRDDGSKGFALVDRGLVAALGETERRDAAITALCDLDDRLRGDAKYRRWPGRAFAARRRKPPSDAALGPGDTLVNLADFWIQREQPLSYRQARAKGCRLIQFIYDVIPETHPHLCHAESIEPFRQSLADIIGTADGYLVASRHVQREFAAYLEGKGAPAPPIAVVPLGWEFDTPDGDDAAAAETLRRYRVAEGGFLLQVGTLEPRKNHMLVVRTLARLYGKLGARLPPTLFVGRFGWRTRPLLDELMSIDYLGGRIRVLHDVDDTTLSAFYRGCRFTLYPSFVEGWGLPVQESLRFGKPCLASHAASIPEAGLDLAEYIDPYDGEAFAAALERWIVDDDHIAAMSARIAAFLDRHSLPRWSDTGRAIMDFTRGRCQAR